MDMPSVAVSYPQRVLLVEDDQLGSWPLLPGTTSVHAITSALLSMCKLTLISSEHNKQHTLAFISPPCRALSTGTPWKFPSVSEGMSWQPGD